MTLKRPTLFAHISTTIHISELGDEYHSITTVKSLWKSCRTGQRTVVVMWHRVLVTNNTTHTQSYAYPLVWKQQLTPRSNLVSLRGLEKGRTTHPHVKNTNPTSANEHDECTMKRMSKHTSIIDLSSPVELVKDFHVRHTMCVVYCVAIALRGQRQFNVGSACPEQGHFARTTSAT